MIQMSVSEGRVPPIPSIVITITIIIVIIQAWTDPQSTAARSKKVRDAGKRQLKQAERVVFVFFDSLIL
jgi:hypothetical protein